MSVDLESREYNGRWYTDVKAWKVSRDGADAERHGSENSTFVNVSEFDNRDIPF